MNSRTAMEALKNVRIPTGKSTVGRLVENLHDKAREELAESEGRRKAKMQLQRLDTVRIQRVQKEEHEDKWGVLEAASTALQTTKLTTNSTTKSLRKESSSSSTTPTSVESTAVDGKLS